MVTVGPHTFDNVDYQADVDILDLSKGAPAGHTIDDDGWHFDEPAGHSVVFDTAGNLVQLTIMGPKWYLGRDGRVLIRDDDGTLIGEADVAAAITQPA